MIFTDERVIFYSEKEHLAELLANKSFDEVCDELENYKAVLVNAGESRYTAPQRLVQLLTAPLIPVLFVVMGFKYVVTGDKYLDSWLRKIGLTSEILNKYFL